MERTNEERDALVKANVGLAYHLAFRCHARTGVDLDDLRQEALLGMKRAAEKYDASLGKFSTYSGLWVKAFLSKLVKKEKKLARYEVLWLDEPTEEEARSNWRSPGSQSKRKDSIASSDPSPEERLSVEEQRLLGERLFARVKKPRDREILMACFEGNKTMADVADEYGISRERVRQIRNRLVKSLSLSLGLLPSRRKS